MAPCALFLSACGTTRPLPQYEPPLARTDFQTVRTTAYTHTESDHVEYGNHNALGGTLQAAAPPNRSASAIPRALPVDESGNVGYRRASYMRRGPQPFTMSPSTTTTTVTTITTWTNRPSVYGSAAADWSRWPAGTIFRMLSTGQIYRVDDYGWALAGRNTIDLYMATPNDMNSWGVRSEPIQILAWGDPEESLRLLRAHQDYRHIKRMVLELQGDQRAAAKLE
jgi:3D (Asp-Asp-Asp) domain-containing protein